MSASLSPEQGRELAVWARAYLREALGGAKAKRPEGAWCEQPGATFVTLRWPDGLLQGCIGSLAPRRSLVADVAANALSAAIHDRRSRPLRPDEVDAVDLEVSILSPQEPIAFRTEEEALALIRAGVDGIVLARGDHTATFLPWMWEELPSVRSFMSELKQKAGLPADYWDDQIRLFRYTAVKYRDEHARDLGAEPGHIEGLEQEWV